MEENHLGEIIIKSTRNPNRKTELFIDGACIHCVSKIEFVHSSLKNDRFFGVRVTIGDEIKGGSKARTSE